MRAYLHFDGLALGSDDGGMQRLVIVFFGVRNVVVEFPRQVGPQVVHDAQCRIAIADILYQDTHGANIEQRIDTTVLALHLAVD